MKNKKGFTLIELLAVIVIIGILFSLSTIAINSIKKKQDVKNARNVIGGILSGAKRYEADHQYKDVGTTPGIQIQDLLNGNYTDFDTSKYSDLLSENVTITIKECDSDESSKLFYAISGIDENKYGAESLNDCGCADQMLGTEVSEDLCKSIDGK